jgi:hypothetical protein
MQSLSFTLTGTTLTTRAQSGQKPHFDRPMSIMLKSSDATRAIAVKTAPNGDWHTLPPDLTATASISVAVTAPIYDIKATGVADDILEVTQ